ncbi:HPr-rel-A system PqqD family peptide chaperone [Novosphingobium subterraneum]|uniref:HPr-rel-A system PqqD family peptide chaperone n=1 Tax=Novosphingobium subterraneum TaxID=48936 RepID=UPI003D0925C3
MGKVIQRARGMLGSAQENSTLLLNVQAGRYHELNEVASRIWELLAQPIDEDDIIATLEAEYDVPAADCRDQVAAFLSELRDRGMLEVV